MGRKTLLIQLTAVLIAIVGIICLLYWHNRKIIVSVSYGTPSLWERILAEPGVLNIPPSTRAVILPHHLITATELTKFYRQLANNYSPDIIVLVGPNHYENGNANIQTCDCTFSTIRGNLYTESSVLQEIVNQDMAVNHCQPFKKEHSIYGHTPFIKNFFPNSKIATFILKWKTPNEEIDQLVDLLHSFTGQKSILVIASVDFSHYLPNTVADFHDQSSFAAIQNFDLNKLESIEVDSPASLRLVMKWAELNSLSGVTLVQHTNSQDFFTQNKIERTTSHEFIAFSKDATQYNYQMSFHFFGDAMFGREIETLMESSDILSDLAGEEKRFFMGNDYNVLNMEGVLDKEYIAQDKDVTFGFNPEKTISLLKKYDFNLVNLANNHIFDHFAEGEKITRDILSSNDIQAFGGYDIDGSSCTTIKNDKFKIAMCGFNDVGGILSEKNAIQIISEAKKRHDQVFVNMHWGEEYSSKPTARQKDLAHKFVDAGADIIIGHHPHVIQPLEIYKKKPIFYSLGNFVFDQYIPEDVNLGLSVGIITSSKKTLIYLIPFHINKGNPSLLNNAENTEFLGSFLKSVNIYKTQIPGKLEIY